MGGGVGSSLRHSTEVLCGWGPPGLRRGEGCKSTRVEEGRPSDKAATKAKSSEPEEKRGSPVAPGLCQDPLEQRCQDWSQQGLVQSPAPPFISPTVSPLSFSVCKMGTVSSRLTRLQEDPGMEYMKHQAPGLV